MKIWEIEWTAGKEYRSLSDDNVYIVNSSGTELVSEDGKDISEFFYTKEMVDMELEEIVDWSKVEIDTKVLMGEPSKPHKQRAYFAGMKNNMPSVFSGGCTSFTAYSEYGDDSTFIPHTIELYKIKSLSF